MLISYKAAFTKRSKNTKRWKLGTSIESLKRTHAKIQAPRLIS